MEAAPKTALTSGVNCKSGDFPSPSSVWINYKKNLQNLLEVLTVTVYYNERNGPRKETHGTESSKSGWSFWLSFPSGITDSTHFSWQRCVTTHVENCQPGKLTRNLVSRVFIGAQSGSHRGPPAILEPRHKSHSVAQGPQLSSYQEG